MSAEAQPVRLPSFAQITTLAIPLLAGGLWAQGKPSAELSPGLRSACDTIAVVLHALRAATVQRSSGSVENPVTHARLPWCRLEARGDVRALPPGMQPGTALVRSLGWRQDPWEMAAVDFATSAGVFRGTVFCIIGSMWNGEQGGRARGQPAYGYYINVDCRVDARRALAVTAPPRPTRDTAPTPAAPALVAASPDSVTKLPVHAAKLPTKERVLGPFTWHDREVRCVLTDVWLGRDTTVSALRLVDARGAVLYQESFGVEAGATGLGEQFSVTPVLLEASDGVALMLGEDYEPSAPMGGVSRKLLVWKDGAIRPLSPALTVYGEFLDLPRGEKPNTVRLLPGNLMPIHVWAYSFAVEVSLEIRLAAFAAGDPEPLRPRVQIDTLSGLAIFPVADVVPGDREETKQVMLYRSARGSAGEPVQVRRTSQIQYGPAYGRVRLDRDLQGPFASVEIKVDVVRLRVTIDGKTGFVEESDFSAVGLGSAG